MSDRVRAIRPEVTPPEDDSTLLLLYSTLLYSTRPDPTRPPRNCCSFPRINCNSQSSPCSQDRVPSVWSRRVPQGKKNIPKMIHAYSTYHIVPHNAMPYHTTQYHTIQHRTIPYNTIPYHTIPYHTIPYHTIPSVTPEAAHIIRQKMK